MKNKQNIKVKNGDEKRGLKNIIKYRWEWHG